MPALRRPRWDWRLVPMALAFPAMNVTFLQSMTLTTTANAIWLQSTAPLWVFLYGLTLYRDVHDPRDLVPLVFGWPAPAQSWHSRCATIASARKPASALCSACSRESFTGQSSSRCARYASNRARFLVVVNHLAAAVLLLPYCLYVSQPVSARQLLVLVAVGFIQMGLPYVLFARGLREISSQEGAALSLLEARALRLFGFISCRAEKNPRPGPLPGLL